MAVLETSLAAPRRRGVACKTSALVRAVRTPEEGGTTSRSHVTVVPPVGAMATWFARVAMRRHLDHGDTPSLSDRGVTPMSRRMARASAEAEPKPQAAATALTDRPGSASIRRARRSLSDR